MGPTQYDNVVRLTSRALHDFDKSRILNDFASELGWRPSYRLDVSTVSDIANAHLVVEHGLENTAFITFLRSPRRFVGLSHAERKNLCLSIEAYKVRLKASIERSKCQLAKFEQHYGVDTDHFLQTMAAEDLDGGDLEYVEWAGEAKLLEGLEAELTELDHARFNCP